MSSTPPHDVAGPRRALLRPIGMAIFFVEPRQFFAQHAHRHTGRSGAPFCRRRPCRNKARSAPAKPGCVEVPRSRDGAGGDRFRPFGDIAQNQHRLSQSRRLFLQSSAVGHDQPGPLHRADDFGIGRRFGEHDPFVIGQALLRNRSRRRIRMNRKVRRRCPDVSSTNARIASSASRSGSPKFSRRCAVSRMGRATLRKAGRRRRILPRRLEQRIDHGVAGHQDVIFGYALVAADATQPRASAHNAAASIRRWRAGEILRETARKDRRSSTPPRCERKGCGDRRRRATPQTPTSCHPAPRTTSRLNAIEDVVQLAGDRNQRRDQTCALGIVGIA